MGPSQDEAQARATLGAMQARLARGPHEALGLPQTATAAEARTAFLELTKVYHPAKFARLSADVQRLSNEVFLALRGAHDALVKALGSTPRTTRSTQMPPMAASGTGPLRAPTQPIQVLQPPQAPPQPSTDRPTVRTPSVRAGSSASAPGPLGVGTGSTTAKPGSKSEPNLGGGAARPPTPQPTAPPHHTSTGRIPTPASGVRVTQPLPTRAGSPPVAAAPPPAAADNFNERAALMNAMEMVRQEQWAQAVSALQVLATRVPAAKAYRALLCYVRGREAESVGRIADAIAEMQRALQIDPAMPLAKTTLAELQTKRR